MSFKLLGWFTVIYYPTGLQGDEITNINFIIIFKTKWTAITSEKYFKKALCNKIPLENVFLKTTTKSCHTMIRNTTILQ